MIFFTQQFLFIGSTNNGLADASTAVEPRLTTAESDEPTSAAASPAKFANDAAAIPAAKSNESTLLRIADATTPAEQRASCAALANTEFADAQEPNGRWLANANAATPVERQQPGHAGFESTDN